jgi:hypothetical protein
MGDKPLDCAKMRVTALAKAIAVEIIVKKYRANGGGSWNRW